MKEYIPQIINKSPEQLEKAKFEIFLEFAFKKAVNNTDAQILITNKALYKWFYTQISLLEEEFVARIANQELRAKTDIQLLIEYHLTLRKVLKLYPNIILRDIRKSVNPYIGMKYRKFSLN